jgi:hypothetical protein
LGAILSFSFAASTSALEPLQPARRHGRDAVDLDGAREIERRRAERLGEVVG